MAVGITAAVITVGGSLLRDKIQSNRGANEQRNDWFRHCSWYTAGPD